MAEPVKIITQTPPLPERADDAHKGDVGRILVLGGRLDDVGMIGAPALAANAALRCGSGLVQIVTARAAQATIGLLAPCATTRCLPENGGESLASLAVQFGADVVAIGPGLDPRIGPDPMNDLLSRFSGGIVIDADGLNLLASMGRWEAAWPHQIVLTPHPGEMRRLLDGWHVETNAADRQHIALRLAQETGAVVVLKGAGTVVTDGQRLYINQTGNSGMATAGAGDVLTGLMAALVAAGLKPFDAAVMAVWTHGRAGDMAAERTGILGLTAVDILDCLPDALQT